ncbi:MAG: uroporphyrinogen decarboxylase [Verrucomicrobia bacterium]|nr:uroporphyrinogen decarboxylase [Verrucomicrobiota bacterium]
MAAFNDTFLRACRREPVDHIPVWFMRQAGRYQPEYREIRKTHSLMDIVRTPDVCVAVTALPVTQLGVDAAILFSDIMTPIGAMGIDFEIREGIGPCVDDPIRTSSDIDRIQQVDFETELPYVAATIAQLRKVLSVPLIGFCGAPFTLASYLVEGGPTKHFARVKTMMYGQTAIWHRLMEALTIGMVDYLVFQANSGAQALQIFDSWVGNLSVSDYRSYVQPHMRNLFSEVNAKADVPLLHFGVDTGHLLEALRDSGGQVIGIDWRTELSDARRRLGRNVALQGNLDPGLVLAPRDCWQRRADEILDQMDGTGYIFNLGHGVLPMMDGAVLKALVEHVHAHKPAPGHPDPV